MIETLENQKYIRNKHILALLDYQSTIDEVYSSYDQQWGEYKIITIYERGEQSLGN